MTASCIHCGESIISNLDSEFCCRGCRAAYEFINELDLTSFYDNIKNEDRKRATPADASELEIYDSISFKKSYCYHTGDGVEKVDLHIGGMSCYACSWLIENAIKKHYPEVRCDINLVSESATLAYKPKQRLSQIIGIIKKLGYVVGPLSEKSTLKAREKKTELVRLGVTTFCFLNIMLLAVPEYIDPSLLNDTVFWNAFRFISAFLAGVVQFYGMSPMIKNSLTSLKEKKVQIDLILSFALSITFIYSLFNTVRMSGYVYFDSFAAVVTFVGWARFFQKGLLQRAQQRASGHFDFSVTFAKKVVGKNKTSFVPVSELLEKDQVVCVAGDYIPADAKIISGETEVSYEALTGEKDPTPVEKGQTIKAGALNLSSPITIECSVNAKDSYLFQIHESLQSILTEKGGLVQKSDFLGAVFYVVVLVFSIAGLYFNWAHGPESAISRTIAALLIACPCSFAIGVPLSITKTIAQGISHGVIFKSLKGVENLPSVKAVIFDKTGTLTEGRSRVVRFKYLSEVSSEDKQFLYNSLSELTSHSHHHICEALEQYTKENGSISSAHVIENFKEHLGKGVEFSVENKSYRIGRHDFVKAQVPSPQEVFDLQIFISIDNKLIAGFAVDDRLHPSTKASINKLSSMGVIPYILSGDTKENTEKVASEIGIQPSLVFSSADPFQKLEVTRQLSAHKIAMVGNGFNDSLAIANSGVGVSTKNAMAPAKKSSDIHLTRSGVSALPVAIDLTKMTRQSIYSSFLFSGLFNTLGLSAALMGYVPPVVAAIAMPISSTITTLIATHRK